ncbi:uncharacterized protein [Macrobrachium rosenbergii]|uniref:uncharacterized protein n=1 Tax=Macrobrachium rosenbergii TaxID=79674 RepID=UPI0034D3B688
MVGNTHITDTQISQIVALYKQAIPTKEIAATTGLLPNSDLRSLRSAVSPTVQTTTGRKRKLTDGDVRFLRIQLEKNPRISPKQLKDQNPKVFSGVCTSTIRKYIRYRLGYCCCVAKRKLLLTRRHKRNRLSYARRILRQFSFEQFKAILYSDEATFHCSAGVTGKVYRHRKSDPYATKYVDSTVKHPDSLMFWGCFSYEGVGELVTLPKTVTMNKEL